ncbi:hypothetical protein BDA99DRAFT_532318 [Phascolomyces articulosus]|uniref:Uncharacterized protein n=1 Tax=Phascolomyces articulosus TaxID=60185 RepID=A0AAD5KBE9_9FUNG|nr:hypothetical protein BDA99DRAFT_532318 [Phascolomyces articulosus]
MSLAINVVNITGKAKTIEYPGIKAVSEIKKFQLYTNLYPKGTVDVGIIEPCLRCTSPESLNVLYFIFSDDANIDFDIALVVFAIHFEALFGDNSKRNKIYTESQRHGTVLNIDNKEVYVQVENPLPVRQSYQIYTLTDLPLDFVEDAVQKIKNATEDQLRKCYMDFLPQYSLILDILPGFTTIEVTGKQYYNCTASIIVSSGAKLHSKTCSTFINLYDQPYRLRDSGSYYYYCANCKTLNFHNTK